MNANSALNSIDGDLAKKWEELQKKVEIGSVEDSDSAFERAPQEIPVPDITNKNEFTERETLAIIQAIDNKSLDPKEITKPIRQSLVRMLTDMSQKPGTIARALGVSRRTISSDLKEIYTETGADIFAMPTDAVAGEIYVTSQALIQKAISGGLIKTAGTIFKEMIQLLQSVGALPQRPKQIRASIIHGNFESACRAYTGYMDKIGHDKPQVEGVLRDLIECVQTGVEAPIDVTPKEVTECLPEEGL